MVPEPYFRQLGIASFIAALLVLVLVGPAAADAKKAPGPDETRLQQVAQRLQLSQDQKQPFLQTMQDFRSTMLATLDRHGVDPQAGKRPSLAVMFRLRSDMKRNNAKLQENLATILTPQQMREFAKIQDERRAAGFPGLKP